VGAPVSTAQPGSSSGGAAAATTGLTWFAPPAACRFLACSNWRRYSSSHSSLSLSGTKPFLSQKERVVASIASSRTALRSIGWPLLVGSPLPTLAWSGHQSPLAALTAL